MRLKQVSLLASASLFGMLVHAGLSTSALAQAAAALSGQVTSAEEGPMEGVLVSAKKDGSTITITVVTDAKGEYSFPADRLAAGHYARSPPGRSATISSRAQGGRPSRPADRRPTSSSSKTKNLVNQLSNAEWLQSAPRPRQPQDQHGGACVSCHTLQRVFASTHDAEEFKALFKRMGRGFRLAGQHAGRIRSRCCRGRAPIAHLVPAAQFDAQSSLASPASICSTRDKCGIST